MIFPFNYLNHFVSGQKYGNNSGKKNAVIGLKKITPSSFYFFYT
jgi:hypothetical protein